MTNPETVTAKNVDLSNCDREQIQFAGATLPHGVLVILREPEFTIVQVSVNTLTAFAIEPEALLGKDLSTLLDSRQVISIIEMLQSDPLLGPPSRIATVPVNGVEWNVLAHRYDRVVFLEFEPALGRDHSDALDLYSDLRPAIARLQNAGCSQEFLDLAVNQIRGFTGFDRVLAYKFLADGCVTSIDQALSSISRALVRRDFAGAGFSQSSTDLISGSGSQLDKRWLGFASCPKIGVLYNSAACIFQIAKYGASHLFAF